MCLHIWKFGVIKNDEYFKTQDTSTKNGKRYSKIWISDKGIEGTYVVSRSHNELMKWLAQCVDILKLLSVLHLE